MARARRRAHGAAAVLATAMILALGACQAGPKDDPLVIRDDDPLKAFMFPPTRRAEWTYRRESVGLIEAVATVSIAVSERKKESAKLAYAIMGEDAAEITQGIGIRGDAEISLLPDGAVWLKDRLDERTYYPDGRVKSRKGMEVVLVGTETITTPAGKFACVKYRFRRGPSADFPMRLEGTQWWGKGAGLVKAVSNVEGFSAGTRTTIELVELEK